MENRFAPINIDKYISLYEKGYKLNQIKPLHSQTYTIFKNCKEDIRIIKKEMTYTDYRAFERISLFVEKNDFFYMIPVRSIKGTIVGFILRGVTKSSYSDVFRDFNDKNLKVPFLFGFDNSFTSLDSGEKSKPVVVCEGSKDCLTIKTFYPYVVANNTSSMGLNLQVLRNMTDKFLLAYDNDNAGMEGMKKDRNLLKNTGAIVRTVAIPKGFKDCSDVYCDLEGNLRETEFSKLRASMLKDLKSMYHRGMVY